MRSRRETERRKFIFQSDRSSSAFLPRRAVVLRRLLIKMALTMAGQSRKWMILIATIWIRAFTGTNFDFSEYSSSLKSVLNISQVQLNYLATANDMGKLFGWSSGLALMYFPVWVVMFMTAFMGFIGYGLQWLVIKNVITLPYFLVRTLSNFNNSIGF